MEPYETFKVENVTVQLFPDHDPKSPREWDNVGVMACWHRRYTLGDVQPKEEPAAWMEEWRRQNPRGIALPLYLYDHGGITMSVGAFACPWDSGQVGWIVCTAERGRQEWGRRWRAKAEACLRGEVSTYAQYLEGDVWGFVVTGPGGAEDSCWGFFGLDECREEATSVARSMLADKREEAAQAESLIERSAS